MRLFFLCFEPLGRYNGYRWPYNPFNAQPSVGNVRLSAVESKLAILEKVHGTTEHVAHMW